MPASRATVRPRLFICRMDASAHGLMADISGSVSTADPAAPLAPAPLTAAPAPPAHAAPLASALTPAAPAPPSPSVAGPRVAAHSAPFGPQPTAPPTPFSELGGGEELVLRLVRTFYAYMASHELALAKTHQLDESGKITERSQERFGRFLIEWLGGPARYSPVEGHPRLRMRHGRVPVDTRMADAWLRCMQHALDAENVRGDVRAFLDTRFQEVAYFLRNRH